MKRPFNNRFDITWRALCSLGLLILAASCSNNFSAAPAALPTGVPPAATAQPSPLPPDTTVPPTSTAIPSPVSAPSQVATVVPGATATTSPGTALNPPSGVQRTVTLADDGKTISVNPGERFLLALDGLYDWVVSVDRPNIVSLVPNSPTDGNQGVYEVHQNGSANLRATGNPKCLNSVPRCLMPSRLFRLQITSAGAVPTPGALTVTLADNGKTITMTNGQTFLLNLGADYDWAVDVADQSVLSRVPNITVIRGAQGVYQARRAGTTTLAAQGKVICPPSQVCPQVIVDFRIQVVVK